MQAAIQLDSISKKYGTFFRLGSRELLLPKAAYCIR